MIGWLVVRLAVAGDPEAVVDELDVPAGVRVTVTAERGRWRFVVDAGRTRTLDVVSPTTPAERAAVQALVESLLADLRVPGILPAVVDEQRVDAAGTSEPPPNTGAGSPVGSSPTNGAGTVVQTTVGRSSESAPVESTGGARAQRSTAGRSSPPVPSASSAQTSTPAHSSPPNAQTSTAGPSSEPAPAVGARGSSTPAPSGSTTPFGTDTVAQTNTAARSSLPNALTRTADPSSEPGPIGSIGVDGQTSATARSSPPAPSASAPMGSATGTVAQTSTTPSSEPGPVGPIGVDAQTSTTARSWPPAPSASAPTASPTGSAAQTNKAVRPPEPAPIANARTNKTNKTLAGPPSGSDTQTTTSTNGPVHAEPSNAATPAAGESPPPARHPPPLVPWVALDAAVRPGLTLAGGVSAGAAVPVRPLFDVGLALSVHPPRSVPIAPEATIAEATVDLEVLARPVDWLQLRAGSGLAVRDYVQHDVRVARAPIPRASFGTEIGWRESGLGFAVGGAIDVDLGRVLFVDADDAVPLFPVTLRPIFRIEFRTPTTGGDIGVPGARDD